MDQLGAVVDGHHLHALGQSRGDLGNLGLYVLDDLQRILPVARHDDRRHDFALAVEFAQAAPLVRPQLHPGDVADQDRRPLVALHHQRLDVGPAAQIAHAAHHVLRLRHLDYAAADVAIGLADDLRHLGQRDAVGTELHGIDDDLILLHEAADAGDLGHALRLCQLVAQVPVLDRAQFGEVPVGADQRILEHPADAGRVGPELRRNAPGEATRGEVQVLQHPRARPVDVGAVLEDDVDERRAEERKSAHDLGLGHRQHRARQRIGDLVLDDLRRLARILGVDDDLDVREVGQGVERRLDDRVDAADRDEHRRQDDEEAVPCRPLDDPTQHDRLSQRP